jgi:hypothetical protein
MIRFGRDLATEAGMAGKDLSVKKYVVRLSAGEREHLQALIRVVPFEALDQPSGFGGRKGFVE